MRTKAEVLQAIADLDADAEALVEGPNLEREFRQRREDLAKELAGIEANEQYERTPRCGNCIYWRMSRSPHASIYGWGECHRNPPQYAAAGTNAGYSFSSVDRESWCGEWLGINPELILLGADKLEDEGMLEAAGLLRKWYHKKPGG